MRSVSVVRRYLAAVAAQDWESAESCLAENVYRIGPFGDVYQGRTAYLQFLRDLMPTLAGYRMKVERSIEAEGTVVVELTETVSFGGNEVVTPESLTFDLDGEGRIRKLAIYIQRITP